MKKPVLIKVRGLILKENKVFLCKLRKWNFYCLPGGTLEPGELTKETLEREFIEELGIKPIIGKLVFTQEFVNKFGGTTIDFWYNIENVEDFSKNINLDKNSHGFELSEIGFYNLDKLENYKPENLKEIIKKNYA